MLLNKIIVVFLQKDSNQYIPNMKKCFILCAVVAALASACSSGEPEECYIPKTKVEFAGNGFKAFSLGADVKLYTVQNPENSSQWTVQAVVPVRKEVKGTVNDLAIELILLDESGVRVRDGLALQGEDIADLLPVYNGSENVERTIVFSVSDAEKKYLSNDEASQILQKSKAARMNFNVSSKAGAPEKATEALVEPTDYPMTIDGLCRKYGVYGMLSQYDRALRNDNRSRAKKIEDQLWAIEKRVKANRSIPERVRDGFVHYIEEREDIIEDRY